MFDRFVGRVATRGWQLAVRVATSASAQAAAKQYALQVGAAVAAMGAKKAADMAENKIEKLEDRGTLSSKAAAVASGVVRVTSAGVSVMAAVVSNAAVGVIGGNELVRLIHAVRHAARNPATTAQADLKNTAADSHKPELEGKAATFDGASVRAALLPADPDIVVKPNEVAH